MLNMCNLSSSGIQIKLKLTFQIKNDDENSQGSHNESIRKYYLDIIETHG